MPPGMVARHGTLALVTRGLVSLLPKPTLIRVTTLAATRVTTTGDTRVSAN